MPSLVRKGLPVDKVYLQPLDTAPHPWVNDGNNIIGLHLVCFPVPGLFGIPLLYATGGYFGKCHAMVFKKVARPYFR